VRHFADTILFPPGDRRRRDEKCSLKMNILSERSSVLQSTCGQVASVAVDDGRTIKT
jgi:hypothetical protein